MNYCIDDLIVQLEKYIGLYIYVSFSDCCDDTDTHTFSGCLMKVGTGTITIANNRKSRVISICDIAAFSIVPLAYVTNYEDNTVSKINTETDTVIGLPILVGQNPGGIAISPNSVRAYVTNMDDTISIIDTAKDKVFYSIPIDYTPVGIVISPNGLRAYVSTLESKVAVINTASKTVVAYIDIEGDTREEIAVSPDGSYVYATSEDHIVLRVIVSVIDTALNTVLTKIYLENGEFIEGIAVSPDGTRVYISYYNVEIKGINPYARRVAVIDAKVNNVIKSILIDEAPTKLNRRNLAISPDGSRLYIVNEDPDTGNSRVSVINTATNTIIDNIDLTLFGKAIAITPNGMRAYVTNYDDNSVTVIDTTTNTVIGPPIPVGAKPEAVAITPVNIF